MSCADGVSELPGGEVVLDGVYGEAVDGGWEWRSEWQVRGRGKKRKAQTAAADEDEEGEEEEEGALTAVAEGRGTVDEVRAGLVGTSAGRIVPVASQTLVAVGHRGRRKRTAGRAMNKVRPSREAKGLVWMERTGRRGGWEGREEAAAVSRSMIAQGKDDHYVAKEGVGRVYRGAMAMRGEVGGQQRC